jgi:alanine racemase
MTRAVLTIDLEAVTANWRALDGLSEAGVETGAVLKADAYGLGAARIGPALLEAGARTFFVAIAEEAAALRAALGPGPRIFVLSGYAHGERNLFRTAAATPILASIGQIRDFTADFPGGDAAVQIDCGMNRLGLAATDLPLLFTLLPRLRPVLILGHLSSSDDPASPLNALQLGAFQTMTALLAHVPRSLAATGGILLGPAWHFALTRPGIGLYGGLPFATAQRVVDLHAPVLQVREVYPGQTVGYGASFIVPRPMRLAIIGAGYADGLRRAAAPTGQVWAGDRPCPIVGRVSMDLTAVDVTTLAEVPASLEILGAHQGIDALAEAAGTIGYEILTGLGARARLDYKEAPPTPGDP